MTFDVAHASGCTSVLVEVDPATWGSTAVDILGTILGAGLASRISQPLGVPDAQRTDTFQGALPHSLRDAQLFRFNRLTHQLSAVPPATPWALLVDSTGQPAQLWIGAPGDDAPGGAHPARRVQLVLTQLSPSDGACNRRRSLPASERATATYTLRGTATCASPGAM